MLYNVRYLNAKTGKEETLIYDADDENDIVKHVKTLDGFYISAKPLSQSSSGKGKIKEKTITMFCYQLSIMLGAGIDLLEAINIIQSKATRSADRMLYRQLYESIQKGNSLSEAMMAQKNVFDELLISMVKMGEQGGDLEGALATMNSHYTKNKAIKDKIRTASIYPLVLLGISIVVVLILVTFVLPGILENFGVDDIPLATAMLMALANFIINYWVGIIVALLLGIITLKSLYDTPRIREQVHHQLLYLPFFGKLMRTILSARLARSFASLYNYGIYTLEMIDLSSVTLNNKYFESRLQNMKMEVTYGMSISESLSVITEFDPLLSSMIKVGEETGSLGDVLNRTADYFESESDGAITKMISIIEPSMIVVMGITIGFVVISIIQPIFKMYETLGLGETYGFNI